MRRWGRRLAIVLVLVASGFTLRYTVFRPKPVPVTVFVVARGPVEDTVTNSKAGTIMTRHRAKLSPALGGRVAEVKVEKGDRVRAGQMLLRIDDSEYRARVELAERALSAANEGAKEACLTAELAERELTRSEGLVRDRMISEQLLDQARNRRDGTAAACQAAHARSSQLSSEVDVARTELGKTVLRAPFDGIVAERTVERGEWISPSPPGIPMPSVVDLIDADAIYVSAPLDEVDRERVSVGQAVRITLDAFPGRSFPGKLTRVAPYILDVAEQSRTFEVEAAFDDQAFAKSLPPGASADVEVILAVHADVLRVPAYAVLERKRVLVLAEDRLVAQPVAVGLENWEFAEITSGLSAGQRVVVSLDRAEVKEGARASEAAVALK